MDLPKRKHLRLKGYDYSQEGTYFLTVCTFGRHQTLARVVGAIHESPASILTEWGKIVDTVIQSLDGRYPNVAITDYVIMPNHVHLILCITQDNRAIRESPLQGKRSTVSKVVGYLKMNVSKEIHKITPTAKVWQRGCHDHIVRCESEYLKIATYIDTNPQLWEKDCFFSE